MDEQEWLFSGENLDKILERKKQEIVDTVNEIPLGKFCNSSDEHLISCTVNKLSVIPIELEGKCIKSEPIETKIDVSHEPILARRLADDRKPPVVDGTKVCYDLPFTGDEWILNCKHEDPFLLSIKGNCQDNEVCLTVELKNSEPPESFNSEIEEQKKLLNNHIEQANK